MGDGDILVRLVRFLETYRGRDRVLRILTYACLAASGQRSNSRVKILAEKLSATRTVLRLLDDFSMIQYSIQYGLGPKDEDRVVKLISVLTNVADQLFYPLEHLAWAAEHKLIPLNSSTYWNVATLMWAFSLYFNIARATRMLFILRKKKKLLTLVEYPTSSPEMQTLRKMQILQLLSIIEHTCDLINAIHWLPPYGFTWSNKLSTRTVGMLGLTSSLIGLYKMLRS